MSVLPMINCTLRVLRGGVPVASGVPGWVMTLIGPMRHYEDWGMADDTWAKVVTDILPPLQNGDVLVGWNPQAKTPTPIMIIQEAAAWTSGPIALQTAHVTFHDFLVTVAVVRPPVPVGGVIGPPAVVTGLGALVMQRLPASAEQLADAGGAVLYRSHVFRAPLPPSPILVQDRLLVGSVTYIVRGVQTYAVDVRILAEEVTTP